MTAICSKCRCKDVCKVTDLYLEETKKAKAAYTPSEPSFEVTIRCNAYIPDKKGDANGFKSNRD